MSTNPYQSPLAIESETTQSDLPKFLGWSGLWLVALGMNLPVPLMFARFVVEGTPWIGIGIALALMVVGGFVLAKFLPKTIQTVAIGGCLTAALQFIPIMHMICGGIAIAICEAMGLASNPDDTVTTIHGPSGGFVATILTAVPILFIAYGAGLAISKLMNLKSPQKVTRPCTSNE